MRAIRILLAFSWMLGSMSQVVGAGREDRGTHIQYRMMTDRTIYVVGEEVRFRVFNLSSDSLIEMGWSRVFYLELISPEGDAYVQLKLPLDSAGTSGGFTIPQEIPTGTYYLKGYTRYMRNLGPAFYTYLSVEVINPYIKTVLAVDTSSQFTVTMAPQEWGCDLTGQVIDAGISRVQSRSTIEPDMWVEPLNLIHDGCVTVARPEVLHRQWEFSVPVSHPDRVAGNMMPETRGITLSGMVLTSDSNQPVPYAVVYVTTLDETREFYCNYADSLGNFYIVLSDIRGETDLFISAAHSNAENLEVFIDQDFSNEPLHLPSFPVLLDSANVETITELCINAQIREQYGPAVSDSEDTVVPASAYFYGEPSAMIHFSDFINLPTLEEYFTEVIPQVALRRSGEHRKFRVTGSNPDLQFFEPLLLVDGVAVFDVESLLEISPRLVDRVELITAPYIIGNVTFGGIINLITTEGNMGYMDLPASGLLVEYGMFSDTRRTMNELDLADPRLPDVRNTLYWNPMAGLSQQHGSGIRISTADSRGNYCVLIRGYDNNLNCHEERIRFVVE